jgi:NAD(P)-dependent dehydrogenase (short-subunit alcohol dehydrogenase family)
VPDPRVALVTGGASGIGAAVVERLRADGWNAVVADITVTQTSDDAIRCDVTSPEENLAAVAHVEHTYGRLDFVHLNAGIATGEHDIEKLDIDRYRQVVSIDQDSVFYGLRAALPALRRAGGGDVIATSSLAGLTAVPFDPAYAMAKHAVVALVRSVGPVYAAEGIRVNALCPGFSDTPIIDELRDLLAASNQAITPVAHVVETVLGILGSGAAGQAFLVGADGKAVEYRFRGVPGPNIPLPG